MSTYPERPDLSTKEESTCRSSRTFCRRVSNLATPDPDAAAAYQEFLPAALATEEVLPYRFVPDLVLNNLKPAQRYVAGRRDDILEHFPKIDIADYDALALLSQN